MAYDPLIFTPHSIEANARALLKTLHDHHAAPLLARPAIDRAGVEASVRDYCDMVRSLPPGDMHVHVPLLQQLMDALGVLRADLDAHQALRHPAPLRYGPVSSATVNDSSDPDASGSGTLA